MCMYRTKLFTKNENTLIIDGIYISLCFGMGHSMDMEKNVGVLGISYILGEIIVYSDNFIKTK